jgi:hypothetical protein
VQHVLGFCKHLANDSDDENSRISPSFRRGARAAVTSGQSAPRVPATAAQSCWRHARVHAVEAMRNGTTAAETSRDRSAKWRDLPQIALASSLLKAVS